MGKQVGYVSPLHTTRSVNYYMNLNTTLVYFVFVCVVPIYINQALPDLDDYQLLRLLLKTKSKMMFGPIYRKYGGPKILFTPVNL